MKKIFAIMFILLTVQLLIPLTAMRQSRPQIAQVSGKVVNIPKAREAVADSFRVCDSETGEITELEAGEYIFGVVAAEMPALYEVEALKAQAVAAYTYACYRRAENYGKNYDITTDHTTDQSFITKAAAAEKWGEKADEYTKKIEDAVKAVEGYMVTVGGKPALTVYHAISSGKTEAAKNVWGKDIDCLQPVDSPGDKLSPDYLTTVNFSSEEVKAKLSDICELGDSPAGWFGESKKHRFGYG